MKNMNTRKAIALVVAFGMTFMAFSSVMALWANPFGLDGYVYQVDGVTQLTSETSANFEMMVSVDEDGDGLYWPADATDANYVYSDAGMNGLTPIDDSFINFAYYLFTMQAGEPGGYSINYKIWVNGSAFGGVTSQDGYCAPVGSVPQADGTYAAADQIFTFPATGGSVSQDFQIPGAPPAAASALATGPNATSSNASPTITYQTSGSPASVDIYYTADGGTTWTFWGNDATVDGSWPAASALPADGTYNWAANPGGDPAPTAAGDIEAGPYILDTTAPTATPTPADGATGQSTAAGTYVIAFSEAMDTTVTAFVTDLPGAAGAWDTTGMWFNITYTALNPSTTYNVDLAGQGHQDVAGNALSGDITWQFTTGDPNPPETYIASISVDPYVGVLPDDVVLTVYGDDTGLGDSNVSAAEYRVDGGAWIAMTPGVIGVNTTFTATIDMHGWDPALSPFLIEARASDGGWDASPASYNYAVSDTTAPVHQYLSPTGDVTIDPSLTQTVTVRYHDFTDFTVADYYYSENGGAFLGPFAMTLDSTWVGSFGADFSFVISAPGGTDGTVDYYYVLTDGAANSVTGATQRVNFVTGAAVQDPYTIFGVTTYYNGNAGVLDYTGNVDPAPGFYYGVADGGSTVDVTWWNTSSNAYQTITAVSEANGSYSVDILNYTDGNNVFVNVTSGTIQPGSPGYNYTTISIATGSSRINPMSGVPYDVQITNGPFTTQSGTPILVDYQIVDIGGFPALGYFTTNAGGTPDGSMNWTSQDPLATFPADRVFDGIGGVAPDAVVVGDSLTLISSGTYWINITESPAGDGNPYLTPWGAWTYQDGSLGYFDDWGNTTVTVTAGSFVWNIVAGWNQISVPADPTVTGSDGVFGAYDVNYEITNYLGAATYIIADHTGGNPSGYTTWQTGDGEGAANDFPTDRVSGYWVYSPGPAGQVIVNATNNTNWGVDNVVNLVGGEWNLLGWTHNVTNGGLAPGGWNAQPTAAYIVGLTGNFGTERVIATWWLQGAQWYQSYVTDIGFGGIAAKNWVYDTNFAFGYWVWVDSAATITFDTEY